MKHLITAGLALLLLLPATLRGAPESEPAQDASQRAYIFVYLVLDHPQDLSQEAMGEAMKGHFANMGVLAEKGDLLIAGPMAEPRIDPSYRGLYVFNAENEKEGRELVSTDPAVKAGVFKPMMFELTTGSPLTEMTRLEKEDEAKRLADPEISDAWVGRRYILAIGPADAQFEQTGLVLVASTLTPIGAEPEEDGETGAKSLLWLDAAGVEEAKQKFKAADQDAWSFYGWYGSACVAQLAGVREVVEG